MKIGIIREGKIPPDSRVPLTPKQCRFLNENHPFEIVVESSPVRCFSDDEFEAEGVKVTTDVSGCDLLLGVKEVPVHQLIPNKTYFFFSHTIKKQPQNQVLLWSILEKNIRLIDYELLTDEHGHRLIAFGRFAGKVGAHNALWTYGKRTKAFSLVRMKDLKDYAEAKEMYEKVQFPPVKIVLTGTGRVSSGAKHVLKDMGIHEVSPTDFIDKTYQRPVFTQLESLHYVKRKDGKAFSKKEFYNHPELFENNFSSYYSHADILINGMFWDMRAPALFSVDEMKQQDFRIQVIADITCDIAPYSSLPSTIRPSTIADPIYGYNPHLERECQAFSPECIDVMAIDNLPNELPRDASHAFGEQFIKYIAPELLKEKSQMLDRATITANGQLSKKFNYLNDYAYGSSAHQINLA